MGSARARLLLCILPVGCGFPTVVLDGSVADATVDSTTTDAGVSDTGAADAGADSPPPVTKGCKVNGDCKMTCTGILLMGGCGCQAYLADSAPPTCDTSCAATGCALKMVVCADGGVCIIQ